MEPPGNSSSYCSAWFKFFYRSIRITNETSQAQTTATQLDYESKKKKKKKLFELKCGLSWLLFFHEEATASQTNTTTQEDTLFLSFFLFTSFGKKTMIWQYRYWERSNAHEGHLDTLSSTNFCRFIKHNFIHCIDSMKCISHPPFGTLCPSNYSLSLKNQMSSRIYFCLQIGISTFILPLRV